MANFIKILMGSNSKSDCCSVEIKEVQETEEKNEAACCGGDTSCC
ncbi:hypothetical protein [Mesobacillus selenatarsenatis]|uniref:Uncharacterized protein n=1 Tax=Mesobacillus selenatarsenatis (strain DSM 18680 / JCM 14380 / FERM P-15431 / SF-1) TaxID=1321606 RepID=A0A0A8XBF9_MESS1|nr:hypothetical protein [Mesobacillus selenatarsenatis]GAM15486.1 hypothetical protein SAMD00020551_3643 [Mesobacillus selenatarsenatis SF-1]